MYAWLMLCAFGDARWQNLSWSVAEWKILPARRKIFSAPVYS